MRTNEIAESLNISRHTVIDWSKRYAEFLSSGAAPPKGTTRSFDFRDLQIFRRVNELTKSKTHDEIQQVIAKEVEDGQFEGTVIDPQDYGEGSTALTLAEARQIIGRYEMALGNERTKSEQLARELKEANSTIADLRTEMGKLQGKLEEIRRQDGRAEEYLKQISDLQRELGRLEIKLEYARQRDTANGQGASE